MKIPGDVVAPGIFFKSPLQSGNKSITFSRLKYSELLRMLKPDGWFVVRQAGSHFMMKHHQKGNIVSVPFHESKEISTGMLRKILKDAAIEDKK